MIEYLIFVVVVVVIDDGVRENDHDVFAQITVEEEVELVIEGGKAYLRENKPLLHVRCFIDLFLPPSSLIFGY